MSADLSLTLPAAGLSLGSATSGEGASDVVPPPTPPAVYVVDYGAGNIFNLARALRFLGARVEIGADPQALQRFSHIAVPGQGAFGPGMDTMRARGLAAPILDHLRAGRPFLGVCLGFQVLFAESEEAPGVAGLGWLSGGLRRFAPTGLDGQRRKVPHMGWNAVVPSEPQGNPAPVPGMASLDAPALFEGYAVAGDAYFVHSFHVPWSEEWAPVTARGNAQGYRPLSCDFAGERFLCGLENPARRFLATQFHPERSGAWGLGLLARWLGRSLPC